MSRLTPELEQRIREWAEYVGVQSVLGEWVAALLDEIDCLRSGGGETSDEGLRE